MFMCMFVLSTYTWYLYYYVSFIQSSLEAEPKKKSRQSRAGRPQLGNTPGPRTCSHGVFIGVHLGILGYYNP